MYQTDVEGLRKIAKNPSHVSGYEGRDSNCHSPEHKSEAMSQLAGCCGEYPLGITRQNVTGEQGISNSGGRGQWNMKYV
jgi:hypothetical protein